MSLGGTSIGVLGQREGLGAVEVIFNERDCKFSVDSSRYFDAAFAAQSRVRLVHDYPVWAGGNVADGETA